MSAEASTVAAPPSLIHALPTRARVRLPALRSEPALAEQIHAAAHRHPGVHRVHVNRHAACVVVEGAPDLFETTAPDDLVAEWLAAPAPAPLPPPAPASSVSKRQVVLAASGLALSWFGGGLPLTLARTACALSALPVIRQGLSSLWHERRLTLRQLDAAAVGTLLLTGDWHGAALTTLLVWAADELRARTAHRPQHMADVIRPRLSGYAEVLRD